MIIFMQKCTIININCQHNAYLENEHNRQKIGEMPKSIIDSSLMELLMITVEVLLGYY